MNVAFRRHLTQARRLHTTIKPDYLPAYSGVVPDGNRELITVHNPADGTQLSRIFSANDSDVAAAIDTAHQAFEKGTWSRASTLSRSKTLANLARILEARIPELAMTECLQTGRPIREMRAQLSRLPEWIDYYAALLRTEQAFVAPTQGSLLNYVQRIPLGVVAQITPFNHPLLIAVKKIAPALAAGNSVVVKPSELAPITVLEFADMVSEAGVPTGVFSVLPGYGVSTGKAIVSNPLIRKVDLTAGTGTGRALGAIAGANLASYTAELGGKAPIVVFEDADLHSAVNGAAFAAFVASGQTCVSGTRLIIHETLYEAFMDAFLSKVQGIRAKMGDPTNPKSTMGPVISKASLDRISSMMAKTKGKILTGGERMTGTSDLDGIDFSKGNYFPPTVVANVQTDDELWVEEVFGPVVVVKTFSTEEEGVKLANDCKYGLGAGIWTQDLSRAHRVAADIQAGLCWVNAHHRNDPSSPWGGLKLSGIGRENGREAYESYSQSKSTIVNIARTEDSRVADDWFAEGIEERRYG